MRIVLILVLSLLMLGCSQSAIDKTPSIDDDHITIIIEDQEYVVVEGDIYQQNGDTLEFFAHLYDPDFYEKNYVEENGKIYIIAEDQRFKMLKEFSSDFEGVNTIQDLINVDTTGWTKFTLQGPETPTVAEYVEKRKCIIKGTCEFDSHRVEPSTEQVYSGTTSLKTVAVGTPSNMVTTKSQLGTELIHFVKGDHVYFSGWYYLEEGLPSTIVDLESQWLEGSGGMRLWLNKNYELSVELKFGAKPKYQQSPQTLFPVKQWVHVEFHFYLHEKEGVVEVWQDGQKIVDAIGQTLPLADTVYNSLTVGITANKDEDTVLFVDDIHIADHPI